jgi:DNA modification methylase
MDRVDTVNLRFEDYRNNSYLTHNFHPYPAKFVPQIPAELIQSLSRPGDWILDPFVGSGTSLVEARLAGRNSVGIDVNPLSCLIARVKATVLSLKEIQLAEAAAKIASTNVRANRRVPIPEFHGIDKWFSKQSQQELSTLLNSIREADLPKKVREFLEVAFASIVVKASNQDSDTRYKAIQRDLASYKVGEYFLLRVTDMAERMRQFRAVVGRTKCSAQVVTADSTKEIPGHQKFDLVLTSPPYLNSYDYYLYHKHRMNWLGFNVRAVQDAEFGSRNKHNDLGHELADYNKPILKNATLVHKRLKRKGHYCIVVGDAILRGEFIPMNKNFDCLMIEAGFTKVREIVFPQRKYTRSFTPGLRSVHKNSYVLIYSRP